MLIYNVTVHVEDTIQEEWLNWMKARIPVILSKGTFTEARFSRVISDQDVGGSSFSIQFVAPSRAALEHYYNTFAETFRAETTTKFGENALAFRTEMELIDEYKVHRH